MRIEISVCDNDRENFEHEGYYDSIDEAIAWLKILKQQQVIDSKIQQHKTYQALKIAKRADCNKCVYQYTSCPGPISKYNAVTQDMEFFCPPEHHYKRDPPDGGYYG